MINQKKTHSGFSLIEVMITLVIIAIIAGLSYPSYQKSITRSKQLEAKTILKALYKAEDLYKMIHGKYTDDFTLLDIALPTDSIYNYSVSTTANGIGFIAQAEANLDGDVALDIWKIDQSKKLENTINDSIE